MILQDNLIIITTSNYKKKLLEENKLKYNLKIYTVQEFKDLYYFKYKSDILLYLKNKFNIIPEISKIIIEYLYNIEDKKYSTDKLNKLVMIKNDLIKNNYIIKNDNFRTFIKNKKIITYNIKFNNYESYFDKYENKKQINIYKNENIEDEVVNVASKIKALIESGIDINKIKINALDGSYTGVIDRIFSFYNIPYLFNSKDTLYYLDDVKKFLNEVDTTLDILDLNNIIDEYNFDEKVLVKIINIINKYSSYDKVSDIIDILKYEFKNTSIRVDDYENVIREIDYKNYLPNDDEYIFMLGFNQDIIPTIHKDNLYLNDVELNETSNKTSIDRNIEEIELLTKFINITKNIYISYKLSSPSQDFGYSNFLSSLDNINEKEEKYDYKNEALNKLYLANRLDNYILYNQISNDLLNLYSSYEQLKYKKYDNNYEKIDYSIIKKQLNNKINLSYSNINTFFQCQFRFMLDNIYKVGVFNETISTIIGKLFHRVLEITYKYKRNDYEEIIDEVILEFYPNDRSLKEEFYLNKYKKSILELINILNENLEKTKFKNSYFEQKFQIKVDNDIDITVKGFVDKIMTFSDGYNTYVIVIDYKTGGMHNDFSKVVYGLDMQLLMYLYLIKNTNLIENPKFCGMYLQQIMTEVLNKNDKKSYHEQIIDNTKLNGYTIDNLNILPNIDSDFDINSYIKGMKTKKDGTFAKTSKVLSEDAINEFIDLVSTNINKVITAINNCEFDINPKKLNKDNVGCEYCTYHDICYMNNNNIVELEKEGDLDDSM